MMCLREILYKTNCIGDYLFSVIKKSTLTMKVPETSSLMK